MVGFCSLYQSNELTYITSFYIKPEEIIHAQEIMKKVITTYNVTKAYVTTCDELFLSVCLDYHEKIELQAYFFDGTMEHPVRQAEFDMPCMRKVSVEEMPGIRAITGDFYDSFSDTMIQNNECELYRIVSDDVTLGVGVMVPNKLATGYVACGEIVLEEHRRKGVARSLQLNMSKICRDRGLIPIGGCWYYNEYSKKTFDSCGRYSKTRLLNVTFRNNI